MEYDTGTGPITVTEAPSQDSPPAPKTDAGDTLIHALVVIVLAFFIAIGGYAIGQGVYGADWTPAPAQQDEPLSSPSSNPYSNYTPAVYGGK